VVSLVSIQSKQSRWVRRELDYADELEKIVIPVRLENVYLPLRLRDRQAIDCFEHHYDSGVKVFIIICLPIICHGNKQKCKNQKSKFFHSIKYL